MTKEGSLTELEEATIARSLDDFAKATFALAKEKGWHDADLEPRNPYELLALLHSEITEMLECLRNGESPNLARYRVGADGKPTGLVSEAADVLIRLAAMAGYFGWDLGRAVIEKHAFNETRPFRHGGKRA